MMAMREPGNYVTLEKPRLLTWAEAVEKAHLELNDRDPVEHAWNVIVDLKEIGKQVRIDLTRIAREMREAAR
jgi:hypothetical protein